MKLSISNIAWNEENDLEMYKYISKSGFQGLEIAPTRIIKENPYANIEKMKEIAVELKKEYNLEIASMQSIWFGKLGNIFNEEDAKMFVEYTKKAIDFASIINCKNLVFGCPKNRNMPEGKSENDVIEFFREIGEYAKNKNTIVAIEPNPTIYGTNFINNTNEAFELVKKINSQGIKVNVDFGTIIQNEETLDEIIRNLELVNHIHISEPNLELIENRKEHIILAKKLKDENYQNYVSIEMKNLGNIENVKDRMYYIKEIFE